jgi:undecaprenyl-diphosphatase
MPIKRYMLENLEILNRQLFMMLNGGENTPAWIVGIAVALGDTLIYLVPLALLWMWLWGDFERRSLALKVFVIVMVAVGVNQLIGLVWQHPRPFMVGLGHAWIPHQADSSFPSDHVTVLSAFGLTLLAGGAVVLGSLMLGIALVVSVARVFLGVHFPLDMVGAFVVAAICLIAVTPIWRLLAASATRTLEGIYRGVCAWPIRKGTFRR